MRAGATLSIGHKGTLIATALAAVRRLFQLRKSSAPRQVSPPGDVPFRVVRRSPESGRVSCLDSINSSHACRVHFLESQIACVRLSRLRMTVPMGFFAASKDAILPRLSHHRCNFGQKTRSIGVHYRETCVFSAKKPDQLSAIMSLAPLFSYTSPGRSSFITSLCVSAPFRTLTSVLVSRHNWRRLESSILCMSSAFSSFGAIRAAKLSSVISGFWIRDVKAPPV